MNQAELTHFIASNQHIECQSDEKYTYFRNTRLPFYANNPDSCMRIENAMVAQLTFDELMLEINRGLDVEQITRITGYFTKVSQWNKGKRGELKDRIRTCIE
jgi:anaerobic ribonucleoside-triphosphate reductase